jgi:hypothetical protein
VLGASSDEIDKTSTAIEFGKKDGGVGLSFSARNPLKARPDDAAVAASLPQNSASIAAHPHFDDQLTGALNYIYFYLLNA